MKNGALGALVLEINLRGGFWRFWKKVEIREIFEVAKSGRTNWKIEILRFWSEIDGGPAECAGRAKA